MIPASHLREKANKKLASDITKMVKWVENLAGDIASWCDEEAELGLMNCSISLKDIKTLLSNETDPELYEQVIRGAKDLLINAGYDVSVDDYDAKTHLKGNITGINLDWSRATKDDQKL
jgi:hypothetical protein